MPPLGTIALVVSLLGGASYLPVVKVPSLRHTMWPVWLLLIVGLGMGIAAMATSHPDDVSFRLGAGAVIIFVAWLICFVAFLRIPTAAGRPEVGKRIQHVSLVSETGAAISPDDFAGKGPLLLIFFRGFW